MSWIDRIAGYRNIRWGHGCEGTLNPREEAINSERLGENAKEFLSRLCDFDL